MFSFACIKIHANRVNVVSSPYNYLIDSRLNDAIQQGFDAVRYAVTGGSTRRQRCHSSITRRSCYGTTGIIRVMMIALEDRVAMIALEDRVVMVALENTVEMCEHLT